MSEVVLITVVIALLFCVMAFRAFRSGSTVDRLLGTSQMVGVLLLLSPYRQLALYLLLLTAFAYLLSQILTGARPISRILPVLGAGIIAYSLLR